MKKYWIGLLVAFSVFGVERRDLPLNLTTSIIVPCVGFHFQYLEDLLNCFAKQTILPDEIVISLSDIKRLENGSVKIADLKTKVWPFAVQWIEHWERKSAGVNRNTACACAHGDILITQDADDIPHPQRVEITKYLFENYVIDHLMHQWMPEGQIFVEYDKSRAALHSFGKYDEINGAFDYVHNGNICLSAKVAQKIKWEDALDADHDVRFNRDVYDQFEDRVFLSWGLVIYRPPLSAFHQYRGLGSNGTENSVKGLSPFLSGYVEVSDFPACH